MASHGFWPTAWHIIQGAGGITGGLVGIVGIGGYLLKRRELDLKTRETDGSETKREVDTAQELTAIALSLLEPVKAALADAEARIKALQTQVTELEQAARTLTAAMTTLSEASEAQRIELEARLAEVTAERDQARAQLAEVTEQRDGLQALLAARDAELDALRSGSNHQVGGV